LIGPSDTTDVRPRAVRSLCPRRPVVVRRYLSNIPVQEQAMKIINTIGWKTPWLRAVAAYFCKELEYPASRLEQATFSQAHQCTYRGWAYLGRSAIKVKINPLNTYPVTSGAVRDLPEIPLADAIEVLVLVTAHEIAHIERWERIVAGMKAIGRRDTSASGTRNRWPAGSWRRSAPIAGLCWIAGATRAPDRILQRSSIGSHADRAGRHGVMPGRSPG
jgi:hypothetical protein